MKDTCKRLFAARHLFLLVLLFECETVTAGKQVTYRIVEYNATLASYVLSASGERPVGSYADFENDFGSTRGNRYNQIPRNKEATLWLNGWEGCHIEALTFEMCSNNSSGTVGLDVTIGGQKKFSIRPEPFDSDTWFGHWVSKDHAMYVEIEKELPEPIAVREDEEVAITLKGGSQEGSVYVNSITVTYTTDEEVETELPLGWVYEKIEAKGKVVPGDVVMIYRNGNAAGDIDGMEQQHFLDAIGVKSTSNVDDPFVSLFTADQCEDGYWTLTNQYGEKLGTTAAQHLSWNEGEMKWSITLGYDGATIMSANERYGGLRFNAPAESYARFWNYTSKSLPLPYLYRRVRQVQPVVSQSIGLIDAREVVLGVQDTLMLRHKIVPATTTDQRISWSSSNDEVATVRSGVVEIHAEGETVITASTRDGGCQEQCLVVVKADRDGIMPMSQSDKMTSSSAWSIAGRKSNSRDRYKISNGRIRRVIR